jgi:hypothetical protein
VSLPVGAEWLSCSLSSRKDVAPTKVNEQVTRGRATTYARIIEK